MEIIDYKAKYERLERLVKEMIQAKTDYHRSNKDHHLFKVWMAKESEVKKFIDPQPTGTLSIDFLGQ